MDTQLRQRAATSPPPILAATIGDSCTQRGTRKDVRRVGDSGNRASGPSNWPSVSRCTPDCIAALLAERIGSSMSASPTQSMRQRRDVYIRKRSPFDVYDVAQCCRDDAVATSICETHEGPLWVVDSNGHGDNFGGRSPPPVTGSYQLSLDAGAAVAICMLPPCIRTRPLPASTTAPPSTARQAFDPAQAARPCRHL